MKRLFRGKWRGVPIALITSLLAVFLIAGAAFAIHAFRISRIGPVEWPERQIVPHYSYNWSGNFTWQWGPILDEDTS